MLAGGFGNFEVSSGLLLAERTDQPTRLGAVEHDGQGLVVLEGSESEKRPRSGGADIRAMLMRVDDERGAQLCGECSERSSRLLAFFESAWVVAEEDVDLAADGEALHEGALVRDGTVPLATGSTRSGRKRASVGETPKAAEPEACSGRQVVQTESERYRAGGGAAYPGARERLGVVVVTVDEQQVEACATKRRTGRSEEPASFRVLRQIAEVSQRDDRVAVLLNGALDQPAQVPSVAVQIAKGEQTTHSCRAYRADSGAALRQAAVSASG